MRDRVSLDESYLRLAESWADSRAYATRAQVGAILVKNGKILSDGYNGLPAGMPNELIELMGQDGKLYTNPRTRHAEDNVFDKLIREGNHSGAEGSTLYLTMSPCRGCADRIIAVGIKRVVFRALYRDTTALPWLKEAGIEVVQLEQGSFGAWKTIPAKPPFPPTRLICDMCGEIPDGKHKSLICRFLGWIDTHHYTHLKG